MVELTYTKKDNMFEKLNYVLNARAKDGCRPILQFMMVKNNTGICVDGYRIHRAKGLQLPDGLYEVVKHIKAKIIIKENLQYSIKSYPDISAYTNLMNGNTKGEVKKEITSTDYNSSRGVSSVMARISSDEYTVNYKYLSQAFTDKATIRRIEYGIEYVDGLFTIETVSGNDAVITAIDLRENKDK